MQNLTSEYNLENSCSPIPVDPSNDSLAPIRPCAVDRNARMSRRSVSDGANSSGAKDCEGSYDDESDSLPDSESEKSSIQAEPFVCVQCDVKINNPASNPGCNVDEQTCARCWLEYLVQINESSNATKAEKQHGSNAEVTCGNMSSAPPIIENENRVQAPDDNLHKENKHDVSAIVTDDFVLPQYRIVNDSGCAGTRDVEELLGDEADTPVIEEIASTIPDQQLRDWETLAYVDKQYEGPKTAVDIACFLKTLRDNPGSR